jgi:hypothetical protein
MRAKSTGRPPFGRRPDPTKALLTGLIKGFCALQACRHLVGDRLDSTGARWGLQGAEAVLKLRALVSNGDFDTYWRYHLAQAHRRVHQTRYQATLAHAA